MHTVILASGNRGKLQEFDELLAGLRWQVRPQRDFQVSDADETGLTFVENALIKARHACKHTGLPAIADDSGLEVDALQGKPGIYSARFAGSGSTDEQNNQKLLTLLANTPDGQRQARYQCVLVYMRHAEDPTPIICQAHWQGTILREPLGQGGFGYDPLFWVAEHQCTAAQLSPQLKNRISHRGLAMAALLQALRQISP